MDVLEALDIVAPSEDDCAELETISLEEAVKDLEEVCAELVREDEMDELDIDALSEEVCDWIDDETSELEGSAELDAMLLDVAESRLDVEDSGVLEGCTELDTMLLKLIEDTAVEDTDRLSKLEDELPIDNEADVLVKTVLLSEGTVDDIKELLGPGVDEALDRLEDDLGLH